MQKHIGEVTSWRVFEVIHCGCQVVSYTEGIVVRVLIRFLPRWPVSLHLRKVSFAKKLPWGER